MSQKSAKKTLITHKASWTLSQILSGVIPLLLAGVMWVLWLTDKFSLTGTIVLSIILTLMGLFFLVANARLKNNSGLSAELWNDEKYTIHVYQRKPRQYWNGKLDFSKNVASLTETVSINFGHTEGLPYVMMRSKDKEGYTKVLTIPLRILIQDEVRKYVASGLKEGGKFKFVDDIEKARFTTLLAEGRDIATDPRYSDTSVIEEKVSS